jgi:hypothetical protein
MTLRGTSYCVTVGLILGLICQDRMYGEASTLNMLVYTPSGKFLQEGVIAIRSVSNPSNSVQVRLRNGIGRAEVASGLYMIECCSSTYGSYWRSFRIVNVLSSEATVVLTLSELPIDQVLGSGSQPIWRVSGMVPLGKQESKNDEYVRLCHLGDTVCEDGFVRADGSFSAELYRMGTYQVLWMRGVRVVESKILSINRQSKKDLRLGFTSRGLKAK